MRDAAFYRGAAAADVEGLRRQRRVIKARRPLFLADEARDEVFTLIEGWAFSYRLLGKERRQILSFLLPGDFVAVSLLSTDRPSYSVETLTDVELCAFSLDDMRRLVASNPAFAMEAHAQVVGYAIGLEDRLANLGRRNAEERMIALLLHLYDRLQGLGAVRKDGSCRFPIRQEHMADALGLTPVHVSRVLSLLKAENLIALRRGVLTVLDHPRLVDLSANGR